MCKSVSCIFVFLILLLLVLSGAESATIAEASLGEKKTTIGKYDVSGMSEKEREWFITFLKGNFFADGWEEISAEILTKTEEQQKEHQQVKLDKLGYKIGREWCKGNDVRKINTSMLKKWGKKLKNTADDAPHLLPAVIEEISQEVNILLFD